MKPKIVLNPPKIMELFVLYHQEICVSSLDSCKGNEFIRIAHKLEINSNCSTLRYRLNIEYSVDSRFAFLCDHADCKLCSGGSKIICKDYPEIPEVPFYYGSRKRLFQYVCWKPENKAADFNLTVSINCVPYSTGAFPYRHDDLRSNTIIRSYISGV